VVGYQPRCGVTLGPVIGGQVDGQASTSSESTIVYA
jgi:hypothetical protein